jgi:hypothetical protein
MDEFHLQLMTQILSNICVQSPPPHPYTATRTAAN